MSTPRQAACPAAARELYGRRTLFAQSKDMTLSPKALGAFVTRHAAALTLLVALLAAWLDVAQAAPVASVIEHLVKDATKPRSQRVAATGTLEVAFSPDGAGESLVLKVIDSATRELRVMAYSFTSAPVTQALLRARHRGVDVELVVDEASALGKDAERGGQKARAALSALANAGVSVRTTAAFAIHHDKVIIADRQSVQTGSFNYSSAAQTRNSENVLVNWHNPALAEAYLAHYSRNKDRSRAFNPAY